MNATGLTTFNEWSAYLHGGRMSKTMGNHVLKTKNKNKGCIVKSHGVGVISIFVVVWYGVTIYLNEVLILLAAGNYH